MIQMSGMVKNRVPQIIFLYWVIKIASTTLGETGADMFSMTFNLGYGVTISIFIGIYLVLLGYKLYLKRYDPMLYWLVFTATAIVGTAVSDYIDRTLALGYAAGSGILMALLLVVLIIWHKKEKSIDVEYITTDHAEIMYWMGFLVANTLGTAAGDFLADDLGMGFLHSAVLISGLLVFIAALHYLTKMPGVLLFWLAFVLTRPFGATFGDFLTKPIDHGGLNLGTIGASAVFAIAMVLAIGRESKLEKIRNQGEAIEEPGAAIDEGEFQGEMVNVDDDMEE